MQTFLAVNEDFIPKSSLKKVPLKIISQSPDRKRHYDDVWKRHRKNLLQ